MKGYEARPNIETAYTARAMGHVLALVVKVGGVEYALERQRGGTRQFKTLDAVRSFLKNKLDVDNFMVETKGYQAKR